MIGIYQDISDNFNIYINPGIRGEKGFYKIIDDILVASPKLKTLEEKMRKLLKVCRDWNMKLNPDKLQLGQRLRQASKLEIRKHLYTCHPLSRASLDIKTPQSKAECQRIAVMRAQLKKNEGNQCSER